MKRIGTFLIAVALVVGMVGCGEVIDNGDGNGNGAVSYQLTVASISGGSVVEPGEGVHIYEEGTVVELEAVANDGYRFVNWTGDVDTVANVDAASTTITMDGDYSVTANFVARYTVTIDSTHGGNVTSPGDGTFTYDAGTVVDLVAEAWEGYKFLSWTGDVNSIGDVDATSTTVTMNDNYAVSANFLLENLYLDEIGPGLWGLIVLGEGVEATVIDEGVLVNIACDPVDGPGAVFAAGAISAYDLEGDFDIRVDYTLITWPEGSGVRVGLRVDVRGGPSGWLNVQRVGQGIDDVLPAPPFREVYLVDSGWADEIAGITDTQDSSGTLRMRRDGATMSCYYGSPEGWQQIYETTGPTEGVRIIAHVWSHERHFGGEEVSVLLGAVEIVEPTS